MRSFRFCLQIQNLTLILIILLSSLLLKTFNVFEDPSKGLLNSGILQILIIIVSSLALVSGLIKLLHRFWVLQDCHLQLRRVRDLCWLQINSKEFKVLLAMLESDYLNILAFQWVDRLGETVRIRNCHRVTRNYFTNSFIFVQKMKRKLRKKLLCVSARDFSAFFKKIKSENEKLSVIDRDDWMGIQYALRPGIDNFEVDREETEEEEESEQEQEQETSEEEEESENENENENERNNGGPDDQDRAESEDDDDNNLIEETEEEEEREDPPRYRPTRRRVEHRTRPHRRVTETQILKDKNFKWPPVDYVKKDGELRIRPVVFQSKKEIKELSLFKQVKGLYLQLNKASLALRAKLEFLQLDQYRKFTLTEFDDYELKKQVIESRSGLISFEIRETLSKNDKKSNREFESEKEAQRCSHVMPKKKRKKKSREGKFLLKTLESYYHTHLIS